MNTNDSQRKAEGALLVKRMSPKAQQFYNNFDVQIYADDRNATDNITVVVFNEKTFDDYCTFEDVEHLFELLLDEFKSEQE